MKILKKVGERNVGVTSAEWRLRSSNEREKYYESWLKE